MPVRVRPSVPLRLPRSVTVALGTLDPSVQVRTLARQPTETLAITWCSDLSSLHLNLVADNQNSVRASYSPYKDRSITILRARVTVIPALVAGISPSRAGTTVRHMARLPRRSAAMMELRGLRRLHPGRQLKKSWPPRFLPPPQSGGRCHGACPSAGRGDREGSGRAIVRWFRCVV